MDKKRKTQELEISVNGIIEDKILAEKIFNLLLKSRTNMTEKSKIMTLINKLNKQMITHKKFAKGGPFVKTLEKEVSLLKQILINKVKNQGGTIIGHIVNLLGTTEEPYMELQNEINDYFDSHYNSYITLMKIFHMIIFITLDIDNIEEREVTKSRGASGINIGNAFGNVLDNIAV